MYDDAKRAVLGSTAAFDDSPRSGASKVGSSTLNQAAFDEPASPPMFEGAEWEAIEPNEHAEVENEEVEDLDNAVIARLDAPDVDDVDATNEGASPEVAAEGSDGGDDSAALMSGAVDVGADPDRAAADDPDVATARAASPDAGADADDDDDADGGGVTARAAAAPSAGGAHGGKYERKVTKASGHDALQDGYNKKAVRSNHIGRIKHKGKRIANPDQIGRPGLRVKGKDEFHLREDYAYRYVITNGSKAEAVDKIWERDLQHGRSKKGGRLALNPSAPRQLVINGVQTWCVMSWSGDQSAAWIAIKDLKGKFADIKGAASALSKRYRPKDAGQAARDAATEMTFRASNDPIGSKDAIDDKRYVVPGQQKAGPNNVGDYLGKRVGRHEKEGKAGKGGGASTKIERANGGVIDLPDQKRATLNVTANLPKDKTPPVAIDTARPGDKFFVPKDKPRGTFRREISMYARTKKRSTLRQTWVFGYIGRDEGTRKVADKDRRGWVPLRVLS